MTNESENEVPTVVKPWVNLLNQHGWPTLMVVIGGMMLWHLASWFEPRATKLIDEHVETVKSLRASSEKQTEILDGLGKQSEETGKFVREIHTRVTVPK